MSDKTDVFLQKSVTYNDQGEVTKSGIMRVVIPFAAYGYDQIALAPKPPAYWSPQRDVMLRSTVYHEPMWAGAIGVALTKMASKTWEISSKIPKRQKDAQQILLHADGHQVGWTAFLCKHLRDFLTTDNGAFIEIVRESAGVDSKITGIRHLDSLRCVRTGDPDIPVMYRDRKGVLHYMKKHQVIMLSDLPDPGESYFGTGMSAASRAYLSIYGLAAIQWYMSEKVSGLHPLAIHIVNGVLDNQLQGAVEAAKSQELSRGVTSYMGAVIVGVPAQAPPEVVTIPLAELPDRFNRKEEFDLAVLAYANALGLDVQDLQPLSGQNLGTGTQSNTLADKAMGKGLVAWQQQFEHQINEMILDEDTEFSFVERDYRDQSQKAAVSKARTDVSAARIGAGITTPQQELVILVEDDELPKEFLPQDATAAPAPLSDEEKPLDLYNQASAVTPNPGQAPAQQGPVPGAPGQPARPGAPAGQPGLPPVPAGFGGARPAGAFGSAGQDLAAAMAARARLKHYTPPDLPTWQPAKIIPTPSQRQRAIGLVAGISPLALELLADQDEIESRSRLVGSKNADQARLKHEGGGHDQRLHGNRGAAAMDLPDQPESSRPELRPGRADGIRLDIPAKKRTGVNAWNYYMSKGDLRSVSSPYEPWVANSRADIANQKNEVVTELSRRTGLPYEIVNSMIRAWAVSSNDTNYESLMLHKAVEEELGAERSEWQKTSLFNAEIRRSQNAADMIENDPNSMYDRLKSAFERYDQNGDRLPTWRAQTPEEIEGAQVMRRKFIRAMYEHTQEQLKAAGVNEVTLLRGVKIKGGSELGSAIQAWIDTEGDGRYNGLQMIADMTTNAVESWTMDLDIARLFSSSHLTAHPGYGDFWVTIGMTVPVERILSTPRTGFGCLEELEFTVLNAKGDQARIVEIEGIKL